MEHLLKNSGAKRVSEDAKTELNKILIDRITELSQKAIKLSSHANRKTIKKQDIDLAII